MAREELIQFDYAIKYLLENKSEYDIVEGFISALLVSQGYTPVKIKALLDPETNGNREAETLKRSIADVIVADEAGDKYIVEIYRSYTNLFLPNVFFNSPRLIVDSIEEGQDYSTIKKLFHINILYCPMKHPLPHGETIVRGVPHASPMHIHLDDTSLRPFDAYNVFPEYFTISVPLFDGIIKQEIDEWLYLIKYVTVKEYVKSPYIKKVEERLNMLTLSPAERKAYNEYLNKSLKERDYLISAEEKGREEGRGEGREEGMEKGREEEKIQIARRMVEDKEPIEKIIKWTGLNRLEVEKLLS